MTDDSQAKIKAIYEKHSLRRAQSRFLVARGSNALPNVGTWTAQS